MDIESSIPITGRYEYVFYDKQVDTLWLPSLYNIQTTLHYIPKDYQVNSIGILGGIRNTGGISMIIQATDDISDFESP